MKDNTPDIKPKKQKSIHSGHRQRVIDKYVNCGLKAFAEHEVLEMILYFSIPQADTNPLAHRLIDVFGSLENVLKASTDELMLVEGVGRRTATLITLFRSVDMYKDTVLKDNKPFFRQIYDIGKYCKNYFKSHIDESVVLLCMDNELNLKKFEVISNGTFNETAMYLGKIAQIALNSRAPLVFIAHNHPGGSLDPSPQDVHFTQKLYNLLDGMKITLCDHFICNKYHFISMAERGLLFNISERLGGIK